MKILSPSTLSIALFLGLATPSLAQRGGAESRPTAKPIPRVEAGQDNASPKKHMKALNRSLKAIGTFLKNPQGPAPMAQLAALQKHAMAAKFAIPSLTKKQPEAARKEFVKAYRMKMNGMIRLTLDLDESINAADWAKSAKILADLGQAKKGGHKKFKGRRKRRRQ